MMPSWLNQGGFLLNKEIPSIGIIGAGTVGNALAFRLMLAGYPVTAVFSRTPASAEKLAARIPGCRVVNSAQAVTDAADITFITTPDSAIRSVADSITWKPGKNAVHCSGSDSVAILESARQAGAEVGGFHPLQTFAGVEQAIENIPGSTFALEATGELLEKLKNMAEAVGGHWITLTAEDKAAYHAAAVFASNYLVTLVKLATDLWKTFNVPAPTAVQALLPLLRGTLHNIETIGLPDCLTGPIARGDTGTLEKHLYTIKTKQPSLLTVYCEMGRHTIPIALAKGKIDESKAKQMESLFTGSIKGD